MESSTTYTPIMHTKLKLHLERHMYKRGANKGEAPMGRRTKTEYRVIDRGTHMAVRLHYTDIVRAYEDGRVMIDCNGWSDRPTTKAYLNEALYRHHTARAHLGSRRFKGLSQLVLTTPKGAFAYYDGITMAPDGTIITPLKPFEARRINKDEVADFKKDLREGGFQAAFMVLWHTASADKIDTGYRYATRNYQDVLAMPETFANHWEGLVSDFAFTDFWYSRRNWSMQRADVANKRTASETWSAIMRFFKKTMYETIKTEVYQISK